MANLKLTTPIGDLSWMFISGAGTDNFKKTAKIYSGTVTIAPGPKLDALRVQLDEYFNENKPRGHTLKETSAIKTLEDGSLALTFKTNKYYPDSSEAVVNVHNAAGAIVALGDKKIGTGSRGLIKGAVGIYEDGPKTSGLTLYLSAVQLTKFVEYAEGFAAVEGEFDGSELTEDGFAGVTDDQPDAAPADGKPAVRL